jgi:hypothetical protein
MREHGLQHRERLEHGGIADALSYSFARSCMSAGVVRTRKRSPPIPAAEMLLPDLAVSCVRWSDIARIEQALVEFDRIQRRRHVPMTDTPLVAATAAATAWIAARSSGVRVPLASVPSGRAREGSPLAGSRRDGRESEAACPNERRRPADSPHGVGPGRRDLFRAAGGSTRPWTGSTTISHDRFRVSGSPTTSSVPGPAEGFRQGRRPAPMNRRRHAWFYA